MSITDDVKRVSGVSVGLGEVLGRTVGAQTAFARTLADAWATLSLELTRIGQNAAGMTAPEIAAAISEAKAAYARRVIPAVTASMAVLETSQASVTALMEQLRAGGVGSDAPAPEVGGGALRAFMALADGTRFDPDTRGDWSAPAMDMDGMNQDRIAWARAAVEAFRIVCRTEPEDSVADLMCDLLHLADTDSATYGTPKDAVRRAVSNFLAETGR